MLDRVNKRNPGLWHRHVGYRCSLSQGVRGKRRDSVSNDRRVIPNRRLIYETAVLSDQDPISEED